MIAGVASPSPEDIPHKGGFLGFWEICVAWGVWEWGQGKLSIQGSGGRVFDTIGRLP